MQNDLFTETILIRKLHKSSSVECIKVYAIWRLTFSCFNSTENGVFNPQTRSPMVLYQLSSLCGRKCFNQYMIDYWTNLVLEAKIFKLSPNKKVEITGWQHYLKSVRCLERILYGHNLAPRAYLRLWHSEPSRLKKPPRTGLIRANTFCPSIRVDCSIFSFNQTLIWRTEKRHHPCCFNLHKTTLKV